jgi:hypothetical protein
MNTFEERFTLLAEERDALYRATMPTNEFWAAWQDDRLAAKRERVGDGVQAWHHRMFRDASLHTITMRALRNQHEPYYDIMEKP